MSGRFQPYSRGGSGGRGGRGGRGRGGGRGGFQSRGGGFSNDIQHHYEENPVWTQDKLFPFEKCFYVEHEETKKLSEVDVQAFKNEHQLTLTGANIPKPLLSFEHTQWPGAISKLFKTMGFDKPTAIQSQGWPMALTGRDVIGIAQTGSGKTLSFILPALLHILGQPPLVRGDGPIALVLAPTRE